MFQDMNIELHNLAKTGYNGVISLLHGGMFQAHVQA